MSQFEICIRSIRYDIAVHTPDYLLYRDRFLLEAEFIHTLLISCHLLAVLEQKTLLVALKNRNKNSPSFVWL